MKHQELTNLIFGFAFCLLTLAVCGLPGHRADLYAEEGNSTSVELIDKAWEAHGKRDIENTFKYTQEIIDLYKDEADRLQASLTALPENKEEIERAAVLNNVALAYFIQGESYMRQQDFDKAVEVFGIIIQEYPFAQAWDPRGWYWQIAKTAQESIDKIQKRQTLEPEEVKEPDVAKLATSITLFDPGSEDFIDYTKFGEFKNLDRKGYAYIVHDQAGLIQAAGEGVYPNSSSVRHNPRFKAAKQEGRLEGSAWDFLHSSDLEAAFFKWATAPEPAGMKLFYTGLILEKAGLIKHAIKCYYAIAVHFPSSYGWTYWHTPWYVGQAAIAKINFILRNNPEFKHSLIDANIEVINGYDNDVSNDIVIVNPGRWMRTTQKVQGSKKKIKSGRVEKILGDGKVRLFQYQDRAWKLQVEGKSYVIKGITYSPTRIGQSPDEGTLGNWMFEDSNGNGKIDGPYDSFVDDNRNNLQDEDELSVGDFKFINKQLLHELYEDYGIMVIMGDFLGKYALGSGASWYEGTDYRNPKHKNNMIASVKKMVEEFKDEPYILFWLLGNENVYGVACNADKDPEGFFKFANEVAIIIKSLDSEHPVALCNGDVLFLDVFAKYCPDIDILGVNAYRGDYGFGYLWQGAKEVTDKPVFITEFGCPAYAEGKTTDEAEQLQAEYHRAAWEDIEYNMIGNAGAGNAIGGIIFEWIDEWWKAYEPALHDYKPLWAGPFPDGFMHEEWLGLCGQGNGSQSPFLRQLRKAYFMYKDIWR
jgi:tetratricopeptide (TPR) repeat protein